MNDTNNITMTIDLHPLHTVKLRTTHMVRHNAYVLTTSEEEPYSLCRQGLIPDTIHGYVQVVDTTTVEAGTSRMVKCIVTGRWKDGISVYFTASDMKYPNHVRVLDAIEKPTPIVRDGMRTQEIHVAIQNASLINFTIGKNTIVGNVEPLYKDTRPKRELPRGQRAGIYRLAIMGGKTQRSHWYEERLPERQKEPKAGPTVERNQAVKQKLGLGNAPVNVATSCDCGATDKFETQNLVKRVSQGFSHHVYILEENPRGLALVGPPGAQEEILLGPHPGCGHAPVDSPGYGDSGR